MPWLCALATSRSSRPAQPGFPVPDKAPKGPCWLSLSIARNISRTWPVYTTCLKNIVWFETTGRSLSVGSFLAGWRQHVGLRELPPKARLSWNCWLSETDGTRLCPDGTICHKHIGRIGSKTRVFPHLLAKLFSRRCEFEYSPSWLSVIADVFFSVLRRTYPVCPLSAFL